MSVRHYTLAELAGLLEAELIGDGAIVATGLANPGQAQACQITFISDEKYLADLSQSQAAAVIMKAEHTDYYAGARLLVKNPYLAFAKASVLFDDAPVRQPGVAASSIVDATASLGDNVSIGANAVIEAGVVLADNVVVGAGCVVSEGCEIGANTLLHANVTLYHKVVVGQHCTLHSGSVIGADGFGFAPTAEGWHRIAQLGGVVIGNHVSIGCNSTIDRGALGSTEIHDHVIIDNLVHIGHNCSIGEGTAIAGCAGIAGSVTIGRRCIIAGGVGISGHLTIADGVQVSGRTVVSKSIKQSGSFSSGSPMLETSAWRRSAVRVSQLDKLFERVKKIEKLLKK
ncbi:UDP-3-O-(3-hydroxymyristoyl)glucosamine N-acyltransferase [Sinobacterium norvegicum]|uniref:UDP-3-O-acylglucosamine N-acyltransferase n=1 Tax=Sinobacterium norvegicum TaxID=1641715 RepID=A0ABM9ABX3_9GAMM|nr:UDP-3-O-(3-hydroxymyristoyl)glucosamine N-acyltransferase [Sinobacterium norvegicum]CAH0990703.1 UDP-3-O-(3-hydroxymyristoyl)glucosamine N-acyltransferase [Sinobacterium norvegicum]